MNIAKFPRTAFYRISLVAAVLKPVFENISGNIIPRLSNLTTVTIIFSNIFPPFPR